MLMLLNNKRFTALVLGLSLSGLISACSNNQAAQNTTAAAETTGVQVEENLTTSQQTMSKSQQADSAMPATDIGVEKAKEIALEKAGIEAKDTLYIKAHLDRDDGRMEYDVEFQSGNIEYEVSVDALTGEINEFSSEDVND